MYHLVNRQIKDDGTATVDLQIDNEIKTILGKFHFKPATWDIYFELTAAGVLTWSRIQVIHESMDHLRASEWKRKEALEQMQ